MLYKFVKNGHLAVLSGEEFWQCPTLSLPSFFLSLFPILSLSTEKDVWPIDQYVLDGFLVSTPLVDRTDNDGGQIEENRLSVACVWCV